MQRRICIVVDFNPGPPAVDGTKHPGFRFVDGEWVERQIDGS